jgi:NAD(P)-dependent dehydrogenase (short-subunit alcohol dehydrogenase family)
MTPTLESFSLKGKTVILTGGAGLYGRGLAAQLAEAGAVLVIASRNAAALGKVAAEETDRGNRVFAETLDQGEEASVLALRDRVLERFGRIDGLVNNAVARPMKSPDDALAAWEESMRINATGLFCLTRAVGDVMARQRDGSIVNIGSMMGMVGPNLAAYEGTAMKTVPDYFFHKAGMINLTRYFAGLYGPSGVRVNCVSPGGFFNRQPEVFVERYNKRTMLGRMAGPRDLGGAVVFLLSPAASYITGANLPVDGGYTAK